jgi:hypothetical protein
LSEDTADYRYILIFLRIILREYNIESNIRSNEFLDINECSADEFHDCDIVATCTDTDGSFYCTCNSGYTGDGRICEG